jgi:hypothetical protein
MMQQTAVHLASLRQLLPFYALLLGVIWTQSLRVAFSDRGSVVRPSVILAIGLSTAIPHVRALLSQRQQEAAGRDEGRELAVLSSLPARSIVLTNHNRVPLIRCWSRRPTYLAPNAAGGGAARGRSWLELNLNYLRTLYPGGMPQLLYLYQLSPITPETVQRALATDAFLRILTTGQDEPLTSPEAQRRAVAAFIGDGPSACPILLRGRDWRCFDMTPIARPLLASFQDYPLPTLKDLPAPR